MRHSTCEEPLLHWRKSFMSMTFRSSPIGISDLCPFVQFYITCVFQVSIKCSLLENYSSLPAQRVLWHCSLADRSSAVASDVSYVTQSFHVWHPQVLCMNGRGLLFRRIYLLSAVYERKFGICLWYGGTWSYSFVVRIFCETRYIIIFHFHFKTSEIFRTCIY